MAPAKKFWYKRKRGENANGMKSAPKAKSRRQRSATTASVDNSTINNDISDEEQGSKKKVRWGSNDEKEIEENEAVSTSIEGTSTVEEIQITNDDKVCLGVLYVTISLEIKCSRLC